MFEGLSGPDSGRSAPAGSRPVPSGRERVKFRIATLFGLGRFPVASGTVASAFTMPLAATLAVGGPWVLLGGTAATVMVAFWSAGAGERRLGEKDPHAVVIDEVAGQLVSLVWVPFSPAFFVAGFFLFRVFDVLKIPPARQLERVRGGAGIVLDDLAAGVWANVALQLARPLAGWAGLS